MTTVIGGPDTPVTTMPSVVRHDVSSTEIDAYAACVDPEGRGDPGGCAPTMFDAMVATRVVQRVLAPLLAKPGLRGVVHLGQRVDVRRRVRAGETLDVAARVSAVRPGGQGVVFDVSTTTTIAGVATAGGTASILALGLAGFERSGTRTRRARAAVDSTEGADPMVVTSSEIDRYAEVSGDRNPLHLDPGFARIAGFADVVAHGMLVLGRLVSMLERSPGDSGGCAAIDAAFVLPVFPGDDLLLRSSPEKQGDRLGFVLDGGPDTRPAVRGTANFRLGGH